MKLKELWKGEFMSIVSPIDAPYEAVNEKDCIMLIPIIRHGNDIRVIIRKEYCPPYFAREEKPRLYYTIISGQKEADESFDQTMLRELQEEAGLKVAKYKVLKKKGPIHISKGSLSMMTFYVIEIQDFEEVPITGDGGEYEKKSVTIPIELDALEVIVNEKDNVDYLLFSAYHILKTLVD